MVQFDLSQQEQQILSDILENDLSDLRMEISHTDSKDFRDQLKDRKVVLEKVVTALQHSANASAR